MESALAAGAPDAPLSSRQAIDGRIERSDEYLRRLIRLEFGDDPDFHEVADRTLAAGRDGLELIGGMRTESAAPPATVAAALEVIVATDGSRPVYIVRNDAVVEHSGPPGFWTERLCDPLVTPELARILRAIGRIDIDRSAVPFAGTGWLIAPDLIVTNRHVAEGFVEFLPGSPPEIRQDMNPRIDFGQEYKGTRQRGVRRLAELVFCGADPIFNMINHANLDLAVFRLEPASGDAAPDPLPLGIGERLSSEQAEVLVIGYPARPDNGIGQLFGGAVEFDRILKLLFDKLWGCKRLAPGLVVPNPPGARALSHDATTLGGNSGSLVVGLDTLGMATGLHYGGNWQAPRVNWAHVLGSVMDEPGLPGLPYRTLAELCDGESVARKEV